MKLFLYEKINFLVICNKHAIVCEALGYPRNGTSVGIPILAYAHYTIRYIKKWQCIIIVLKVSFIVSNQINPVVAVKGLIN